MTPVAADAPARGAQRATAILTVISGDVSMRTTAGTYALAADGTVLYVGTQLRTSADARALITLSDGSTVELDAASDITIEDGTGGGGRSIAQSLGRALRVVMHLTTADSRYELNTPASTASVRGGEYEVVAADGLGSLTTAPSAPDRVVAAVAIVTSVSSVVSAQTTVSHAKSTGATRAPSAARSRDRVDPGED